MKNCHNVHSSNVMFLPHNTTSMVLKIIGQALSIRKKLSNILQYLLVSYLTFVVILFHFLEIIT